jgi:carbon storage regulator
MLVLSRKLNEKIVIDGGITITVVRIDKNQVRLGIQAPGDVSVYREELLRSDAPRSFEREVAIAAC